MNEPLRRYSLPGLFSKATAIACQFEPEQIAFFLQAGLSLPSALSKAVAKRQTEFLAGRYCVQQLYQQSGRLLELPAYRENQCPVWPAGYLGSISHTRGIAAAVVGLSRDYRGLGLDLEYKMSIETAERVKKSILRPDEIGLLAQSDDWIRDLTIVFSFKESLYKALNPSLNRFIGFDEVQVIALQNACVIWQACEQLKQDLTAVNRPVGHYFQQDDLILTSCEWLN